MVKESQGSEKMVMLETEHSTLNKIIGKKISIEKLEEILFNLGFELEDVQGDNIKIDVTTERPDLLSTYGLGRTLRAYLGRKNNSYKIPKSGEKLKVNDAAKEWPCAVACIVKGLKFDNEKIKEVIRIQEKLGDTFLRNRKKGGIGIYPLDKIKFPVRFTAEIPEKIKFTPLESKNLMNAHKILEEHPTGRKYKHIIEEWKKFPIFIDTNDNIMSMPPIINSHNLGKIDEKTKDVFVEATGQDLKTINMALQVLAAALIDMGGKAYSIDMIYGNKTVTSPNFYEEKRTLKVQAVNKILGLDLKANEIKKLLEKMSYKVISSNKKELKIIVDSTRRDIWHDVDLIDDIARAYGFNNFKTRFKHVDSIGETTRSVKIKEEISSLMVGLGYQEAFTLILTDKDDQFRKMNIKEFKHMSLGKSVEQSINMTRAWLLPELIKCLKNNRSAEYPQKIFEINHVIIPDENKDVKCKDILRLAVATSHSSASFTEIKQVLDYVINLLGFNYELREAEHNSFINGRSGRISVNGKDIAYIGEVHPQVLENYELEMPVAAFELNLTELFENINKIKKEKP